jgi:hypothetical protein
MKLRIGVWNTDCGNLSEGMIKRGAQMDTMAIIKDVKAGGVHDAG